ncbi:MAG: flagellar filament capping protein FliD [Planctomycetota bacterium]|jgi:flagellar hook-associated protein 2
MSTAGISFGGLASGLDTKAIISALVAVEERPIRQLEAKKSSLNKQKSLFGDLKGLLDKLTTAAKALKRTTDFLSMKASSSDDTVLGATVSSSATPGTYSARVIDLARSQVNSHSGSASRTAAIESGPVTLQIDTQSGPQFVDVTDPSLDSLAAAINSQATGVRAEVVDTGNTANGGASRYQLVVRSSETGVANGFSLSVDSGLGGAFEALVTDLNSHVRTPASDAELLVNGAVTVTRSTNTIGDLWTGITLDLKSVPDPNKDITITVSTDAEETSKKVQEVVDAYNKVVDFFTEQNKLDAEGKASSPLFGDVTLRSIRSSLRTVIGGQVEGTGNQAYQLLSQIGVTADTAGKLTFSKSKFEEALAADEAAVASVFTHSTNGIAQSLETKIDLYTDGVDGLLKARTDGFDRMVKSTSDRIEQSERRLELYQKQLEQKYANLESLLSRLQSQGSGLSSIASIRR